MFIETHTSTIDGKELALTFVKSLNVKAFPCGRRRSTPFEPDGENITRIPFDPEARLNTEANNTGRSSLNGYTNTYLKEWNKSTKQLVLSIAGYLFTIDLPDEIVSEATFGNAVLASLKVETATNIYANILLEDVQLFQGDPKNYYTRVLRSQAAGDAMTDSLDLPIASVIASQSLADMQNKDNYYFSGLSFSAGPATGIDATRTEKLITVTENTKYQLVVSLCILDLVSDGDDTKWQIHQPAYLPFIEHGDIEDSVVVGDTLVRKNLTVVKNVDVNTGDVKVKAGSLTVNESITAETGNITVSEGNITVTKGDINISDGNITIAKKTTTNELQVNTSATINDLDVTTTIDTADLVASTSISSPLATITETLNVQSNDAENPAEANIDKAAIGTLDVTTFATIEEETVEKATIKDLSVHKLDNSAKADIDKLEADYAEIGDLKVKKGLNNSNGTIEAVEISADKITQNGNAIPAISLVQSGSAWQLQITLNAAKS